MNLEYGKPEGHTLLKDRGDWFEPSKMAGMKKGKLPASLYLFFREINMAFYEKGGAKNGPKIYL